MPKVVDRVCFVTSVEIRTSFRQNNLHNFTNAAFTVKILSIGWFAVLLLSSFQIPTKSQCQALYFNFNPQQSRTTQHTKTIKVVFCVESGSFLAIIMSKVIFYMDHIMMEFRLTSITSTTRHSFFFLPLVATRDRRKRKKTEKIDSES